MHGSMQSKMFMLMRCDIVNDTEDNRYAVEINVNQGWKRVQKLAKKAFRK
jgi:hypothetical protein